MPRIRVRKTDRGRISTEIYEKACQAVFGGQSIRAAAKTYGLCNVTLLRYVRRKRTDSAAPPPGYRAHNKVFSEEHEASLKQYLIQAADIFFGLSPKEVRRLAYQLARQHGFKYPPSWDEHQMAGKDWFANFMERSPSLPIRRPQNTSLSRATSFNPTNLLNVSPQYLHANSTSHTWAFGAIAELIDNACDPDVNAKQLWIDWKRIKDFDCLTFTDNGAGLDFDKMHKMLSFDFSDKQTTAGHGAVGLYGNGFKSSSMFLGKDVIVFSKQNETMIVGLLSQNFLAAIKAQTVVVPVVIFRKNEENNAIPEQGDNLKAILKHSLFQTEEQLLNEFDIITSINGTRIIIWNLRRTTSGQIDFEFKEDSQDIQIQYVDSTDEMKRPIQRPDWEPEYKYSLRTYCSILYLKPWMQILIRGQQVKTQLVAKSLAHTVKDKYTPRFLSEPITITFGFRTKRKDQYGVLMYYKNRLICPYVHVGCQLKANAKAVGVVGVIECDFLKPTHNKQGFDDSEEYRKIKHNLGVKLEEYWEEMRHKAKDRIDEEAHPDQNWVQCNDCLKWRKLAEGVDPDSLPDLWFCHMNEDPKYRSCRVAEEPEDSNVEQLYEKKFKQEKKKQKLQQKRRLQNSEDRQASAMPSKLNNTEQRRGVAQTSPASSTTHSYSGDDPSDDSPGPDVPLTRLKRKLFITENREAKRAKTGHQTNTSEAAADTAASELFLPMSPITITLEQNSMQVQTATQETDQHSEQVEEERDQHSEQVEEERDQFSEQVETVKQERDQYGQQVETVNQERDQHVEQVKQERDQNSEHVETVTREKNHYNDNVQSVTQERDQYREQVKTLEQERAHYLELVKAVTEERDQYREQVIAVTQERDNYRKQLKTVSEERDQYRSEVTHLTIEAISLKKQICQNNNS